MKKNIKVATAIAAALLAVAPIAGVSQAVRADDTTASEDDSATYASFKKFYFRGLGAVNPATDRYVSNKENGELAITLTNESILFNGKKQVLHATGDMPVGTYHASARVRMVGFDKKSKRRVLSLRSGNHPLGELLIPAHSKIGRGYIDFSVKLDADGADSPVFHQHKTIVPKRHARRSRR